MRNLDQIQDASIISCSPNGQHFATGHNDGTVTLWDIEDGEPLDVLRAHDNAVNSLAFSPDGRHLASAADQDGEARVWEPIPAEALVARARRRQRRTLTRLERLQNGLLEVS